MKTPRKFFYPVVAAIMVIFGLYLGVNLQPKVDMKRASKFEEVLVALEEKYVDSVNKDVLFNDAINEMLHKLDPHSRYISKDNLLKEQQEMQGSFGGIGVRFQRINDTVCVILSMQNGPAYKAGIRNGDQILSINGNPFIGSKISNDMVMEKLRGEQNSPVSVKILRDKKILEINIIRGEIALETIDAYFMMDSKMGYLKINQFSVPTYEEFQRATKELLNMGMQTLILDLRGNPGGVLDVAVAIADEFLEEGEIIVSVKGKAIANRTDYATSGGMLENTKLAVLIDESSASAAEILAGAIQDNDRGMLYGRRTFGKGLVQQDQILRDGSSVRMTISRYYTPSGRTIQRSYEGDYDSYVRDESRFRKGELFYEDSIPIDRSKPFKTKKGRTVYGGGGIVPDVFVPYDSSDVSVLTSMLLTHQVFSAYVFGYLKTKKNPWNSVQSLQRYVFSEAEWKNFESLAQNQLKINDLRLLLRQDKRNLIAYLKEEFSRQIWQESNQIRFLLGRDQEMNSALKNEKLRL